MDECLCGPWIVGPHRPRGRSGGDLPSLHRPYAAEALLTLNLLTLAVLQVALTGNIASGKSAVARVWRSLGARVVDSDDLARRAVAPGSAALARIAEVWGDDLVLPTGDLDRARLRHIVFADPAARLRLEGIVHPVVEEMRRAEVERVRAEGASVVVAEIPLLFELGLGRGFDLVVFVDAPERTRLERLQRDRGLSPEEAARMLAAQLPPERKREQADLVIENNGSLEDLERRAVDAWRAIEVRALLREEDR